MGKALNHSGREGDEHRQRLRELHVRVNRGLRIAHLTEYQRRRYRQATRAVIARMSRGAVSRLHANASAFAYYSSHDALMQAVVAKYPALTRQLKPTSIIKGMFDRDGVIHLNGGGSLRGKGATLAEFHAHELAHALDGTAHALSDSAEWGRVWADEILGNDDFSPNAQAYYREAFSEVGSLLLSGEIGADELALPCPRVVRFWQDAHLLAGE